MAKGRLRAERDCPPGACPGAPLGRSLPGVRSGVRQTRLVLAAVLLVLAALTARMLLSAREELALARGASDFTGRVVHLRRAMAHYLPGNPYVRRAHDQLLELARRLDREARSRKQALEAYRELRSAILALRGVTSPYGETLPEVNRAIVRLQDSGASVALRQADLARLQHPPRPEPLWTAVGLLGFVLWVAGGALLALQGLRPDLTLVPRRFWPLLALVLVGLVLFGVGMGRA